MQELLFLLVFSGRKRVENKLVIILWQITVLQLSALLKQADSSKRKLTLTRLASAPVPFTVLSLTGNPCKEDYLAVCGLKVILIQFGSVELRVTVTFSPVLSSTFSYSLLRLELKSHWEHERSL